MLLPEHEIEIRVRYHETDRQGHVHHANYLHYFELGRTEQLRSAGYDLRALEEEGLTLVIAETACRHHLPCSFGDTLTLKTRTARATAARLVHQYRLMRGDELLAEGETTLASVGADGRPKRLPAWLRDK